MSDGDNTVVSTYSITPILYDTIIPEYVLPVCAQTTARTPSVSWTGFINRLKIPAYTIVFAGILILGLMFIIMAFTGPATNYYSNLVKPIANPWIIRTAWVVATVLSYVGYFLVWKTPAPGEPPIDLTVNTLYLIGSFMVILWTAVFYYGNNLALSLWILGAVILYRFWVFIYFWYIRPLAALFLLPDLFVYFYLIYFTAHLAYLNNIPL